MASKNRTMTILGRVTPACTTAPSAQVVGNAFVDQYYHILHLSPELVYRFYQDSSMLSRPELNGVMTSVTTKQAINEKILSLDYKNFKAEIKTADVQESYKELEPSQATDQPVMDPGTPSKEVIDNGEEVCDPSDNEEGSIVEEVEVEQPAVHSSQNEEQPVVEMTPSVQEDVSKKSYASIGYYHVDMWLSKVAVCWLGCYK